MGLFGRLYAWTLKWAGHPRAPWALGGLSFAESSVFPIPPDVLLAPMCLAQPRRAMFYAHITTAASVAGGLFGYLLGYFAIALVKPWIVAAGYLPAYETAAEWFVQWGFWVILVAGFSPVPYKVFTVAAGATGIGLIPFVLGSVLGRGARFYAVAGLVAWGGPRLEPWLRLYIERIGWICVVILILGIVWWQNG